MRKWFMRRVLPGVDDTLAKALWPVSMLMSDDLPTLLRPMKAMSRRSSLGTCEIFSELHRNSALLICIAGVGCASKGCSCRKNRQKNSNGEICGRRFSPLGAEARGLVVRSRVFIMGRGPNIAKQPDRTVGLFVSFVVVSIGRLSRNAPACRWRDTSPWPLRNGC